MPFDGRRVKILRPLKKAIKQLFTINPHICLFFACSDC